MEPITITLGVITVIAALAAIGLVLWGALRGVMWMVVIGAILALLTPWAGPLWFGWSWWTSLFLTLLVLMVLVTAFTNSWWPRVVAGILAVLVLLSALPFNWLGWSDTTFERLHIATLSDIRSADAEVLAQAKAYTDEKVAEVREDLQKQIDEINIWRRGETLNRAEQINSANDRIRELEERTATVVKDGGNITVAGSPVDMTEEVAAEAVARVLYMGGLNEGEFRVSTTDWTEFQRDVVQAQAFSTETSKSHEAIRRIVKSPATEKEVAFSAEREKVIKAEATRMGLDPEKEWARYLTGTGIVPVQYLVPIEYTGNGYFDGKGVKYSTKTIRHAAGEVVFFYVASNGEVVLSASDRAACTNPGFSEAPKAAGRKPRPAPTKEKPKQVIETPGPKKTPAPTPEPSDSPSPTPEPTPVVTPTPTPSATPTLEPKPSATTSYEHKGEAPKASAPATADPTPAPVATQQPAPKPSPRATEAPAPGANTPEPSASACVPALGKQSC